MSATDTPVDVLTPRPGDPYAVHGVAYGEHALANARRVLAARLEAGAAALKSEKDAAAAGRWATAVQVRRAVRILAAQPIRSPQQETALGHARA